MKTPEEQKKFMDKLQKALDTVYAKVVEFKKQKGTDIVIMQDGKIVHIDPNTINHIES